MPDHSYFSNLIWQIADLLRGPYRPPQYERVMLPMTVLRRFDCVLAPTKAKVLAEHKRRKGSKMKGPALERRLNDAAGQRFHNHSALNFERLRGDPDNIAHHITSYIQGFSAEVRLIFEDYFEFGTEIEKMGEANILYSVVSEFCKVDLHPDRVPNEQMGLIFENLIRRFNELANETAGDDFTHPEVTFTPREVIRLMVNLLFIHRDDLFAKPGVVRKLLDPACGTGGMLAEAQSYLRDHHADAQLYVYGQDYNKRAYATAASYVLMKQVDHNGGGNNVRFGDSLTEDKFVGQTFDYFLTNPPFGVDWKRQRSDVKREHEKQGFAGRFGAGLPRVNDGSLLFLQHMLHKFEPVRPDEHKHGARLAIVFSGSPLFTGGAGSGESNIRRWIIENDWLEAIIALPEQMFYNTSIGTYIWIVTNNKERRRKGKIQLLDARDLWTPGGSADSRRNLGDKRRHLSEKQIKEIVYLYGQFREGDRSKIFKNEQFGYTRITVERPLRLRYQMNIDNKVRFLDACPWLLDDVQGIDKTFGREPKRDWNAVRKRIGASLKDQGSRWKKKEWEIFRYVFTEKDPDAAAVAKDAEDQGSEPDPDLRDHERIPLTEEVGTYFEREVRPHVPDASMDRSKDRVGYEINFNRYFYKHTPQRSLEEIDADLNRAAEEIMQLLGNVTRTITCGLDPSVPLRDSGISWANRVPAHWEIWKLGHLAFVGSGATPSRNSDSYWADEGIPWLNSSAVNQPEITSTDQFVTELATRRYHLPIVKSGAVLIAITGQGKTRGRASVLSMDATINQHLAFIQPRSYRLKPWFLKWTLSVAYDFLRSISDDGGGTKGALTCEQIENVRVPVPPANEQERIVNDVTTAVAKIDHIQSVVDRTISIIKDRRIAVLSGVVTGQIDLRSVI